MAFLVTVALLGWRAWERRRVTRDHERALASLRDEIVDVAGFEAIDAAFGRARCPACGSSKLARVGEGPAREPAIYAVQARCGKCGAQPTLRYRLPTAIQ